MFDKPSTQKKSEVNDYSEMVVDKAVLDSDPVGLPDAKDIENIKVIFRNYDKARPGEIKDYADGARELREATMLEGNKFNKTEGTDKGLAAQRRVLSMPTGLFRLIEEAYPLMFRNRRHLAWFRKNFPHFNVSEKF